MSTVNWSWSWSAYYGSYTFFFGHHLCILFNNIEKLSVPVQRLQNEQQYSSSLCSVCEKFWLMPVAIWTLSLQGLHAVDEQKGKGFSLALCLHPGKIPTSIEICLLGSSPCWLPLWWLLLWVEALVVGSAQPGKDTWWFLSYGRGHASGQFCASTIGKKETWLLYHSRFRKEKYQRTSVDYSSLVLWLQQKEGLEKESSMDSFPEWKFFRDAGVC